MIFKRAVSVLLSFCLIFAASAVGFAADKTDSDPVVSYADDLANLEFAQKVSELL